MGAIASIHVLAALLALGAGAVVLLRRKGTAAHRRLGWTFVVSLFVADTTAFGLARLFDGMGPFHAAALINLLTLLAGVAEAVRRRAGWIERHYFWITMTYVGLVAATAAEIATRVPRWDFAWAAGLASLAVTAGGGAWVVRGARRALAPFRDGSR